MKNLKEILEAIEETVINEGENLEDYGKVDGENLLVDLRDNGFEMTDREIVLLADLIWG